MNSTLQKNFSESDGTLGLAPIECGWDNPNCLGGYSTILTAGDAANEPMRSRWFYDIAPSMQTPTIQNTPVNDASPTSAACNCFTGTPVMGSDGVCRCETTPAATTNKNSNGEVTANGSATVSVAGVSIDRNLIVGGIVLAAAYLVLKGDK